MAITIVKQIASGKLLPAFNHQNFTLNSNMNGQCNFRYLTDVYVNGVFRFRLKTFPDPQTGFGFIQIGRVVEDYIANWTPSDDNPGVSKIATTTPGPYLEVYCKFGEEYDGTSGCTGAVNQFPNLATSNTYRVWNAAVDYENYPSFDSTKYTIGTASSTTSQFLTLAPRTIDVYLNDSYNLTFYSASKPHSARITLYKENGTTNTIYITGTGSNAGLWSLACGPYQILKQSSTVNLWPNGAYSTITPLITCATTKYEVTLMNSATQSVSETFTFNLKSPKEFRTRLAWTGQYGNPERYTFYHRNRKSYTIQRTEFNRNQFSNIANEWTYQVGDRGRTSLTNTSQEVHSVSTFARKEDSEFMTSLWRSNNVWVEQQPRIFRWRVFRQASKMIFQVPPDLNLKAGDQFWTVVNEVQNTTWGEYNGKFTVASVSGPNNVYVDCNLTYSAGFPPFGGGNATTEASGIGIVIEPYVKLPIIITDQSVEVSQRTNRPVTYQINYEMAFEKNTIKS